MKKAKEAFDIDNGTVYEGQVLPDSHPAVLREAGKFTDAPDPTVEGGQPPAAPPEGHDVADQSGSKQASDADNPTPAGPTEDDKPKPARKTAN